MWIFGQVWFACLVGFAVGVALDWVVRVRPLSKRVDELEARLANASRKLAGQDSDSDGYGRRSVFDRGFGADADGFVADRNRGGLLTTGSEFDSRDGASAGDDSTMLVDDLVGSDAEPERGPATEVVSSGVDDFPGVARLSGAWDTDRNQPVPAPVPQPAEQPWQQRPPAEEPVPRQWQPEATEITPVPAPAGQDEADQQYLEFLRAGSHPESDDTGGELVIGNDYTGHEYGTESTDDDQPDTPAEPGSTEVTSVLPAVQGDAPQLDSYDAYDAYAQEDYQQNGYSDAGYAAGGYQFGEYQPEEFEEPAESSTPLPRRGSSSEARTFTPFAPFEFPMDTADSELVDVQPRSGDLTPIEEGGFQPFQKPAHALDEGYEGAAPNGAWIGDDSHLIGQELQPANGAHALGDTDGDTDGGDADAGTSSWFDMGGSADAPRESAGMTQRMLPVSRPDLDHPDLLPESVFGTEGDTIYAEEGPARSLFEPIVPADTIPDDYAAPADLGQPADFAQAADFASPADFGQRTEYASPADFAPFGDPEPAPAPAETTEEFFHEAAAPRPVRVRTGLNGPDGPAGHSNPAMAPVPHPDDTTGGGAPGPFGPGSALPLPDGSAPSPDFRIKARTSSMVFHTESSPFYERLEPQVWFRDADDAQRAGFTSWERPRGW